MTWFRCSTSGNSDDIDLNVTCSITFAGSVITCTDGTKTFQKNCPSTAPYVVTFKNISTGTWTVSGIFSGTTYSKTVTITDIEATLTPAPNGSTVTPTDDIQTWLHCAEIWDKSYTTISAVLADTTTLLALIASSNAADYMARSTTWASSVTANSTAMTYIGANNYCANKLLGISTWRSAICNSSYFENVLNTKVPTMTGMTTPSGEVVENGVSEYANAYGCFRGVTLTTTNYGDYGWLAPPTTHYSYIGYKFTKTIKLYMVKFKCFTNRSAQTIPVTVQVGTNKANYQNAKVEDIAVPLNTIGDKKIIIDTVRTGNTVRIYDATSDKYWYAGSDQFAFIIGNLQFYGRVDV